jgi:hypothetical protein
MDEREMPQNLNKTSGWGQIFIGTIVDDKSEQQTTNSSS